MVYIKHKRRYKEGDPVYVDFPDDGKGKKIWCENCERWISPSYYKGKKPQYVHSCYSAAELRKDEWLNGTIVRQHHTSRGKNEEKRDDG